MMGDPEAGKAPAGAIPSVPPSKEALGKVVILHQTAHDVAVGAGPRPRAWTGGGGSVPGAWRG